MDQYQTLSLLNLAMIHNGIFTFAVFFILWVAFRMAVQVRGDLGTMMAKVLTTLFGLMIVMFGLQVFAGRAYSMATAAKSLSVIKASGQALSVQAESYLAGPYGTVPAELQFSLFSQPTGLILWALITIIFLGVIWLPVKRQLN